MDNEVENIPPDDQQPPGDSTPVAETSTTEPDPPAEITTTSALPVRIPTKLLTQLDNECSTRGIARSELVREILTRYYAGKDELDPQLIINRLSQENNDLRRELEKLPTPGNTRDQDNKLMQIANYAAELENDVLKAVQIACKAIIPARSDFRKNLKHYGRLEADRTH